MLKVGFVGWRGMVGSVLMQRMKEENDFNGFEPIFFSTTTIGKKGPDIGLGIPPVQDSYDLSLLKNMDIIVTCQGGDYTKKIYYELKRDGWKGYWIDSASTLRMEDDSIIVLDPVNRAVIDSALNSGIKTYVGGNCTVSLMLMALNGLFKEGLIEWITSMTYQAASGAGAKNMIELIKQMHVIGKEVDDLIKQPSVTALEIDKRVTEIIRNQNFPTDNFGAPLAASLIPWIDRLMENGQTREEWKGYAETNKILNLKDPIPIDGICVRVGAMRCHSQAFTIKLNRDVGLEEIIEIIRNGNSWVKIIPNEKEATVKYLTPAAVSGNLDIPVGRIRKMVHGPRFLTAFSCGDQLLWGAAEPIRRILKIILEYIS